MNKIEPNTNFFLCGGAGFIGSNLAKYLIENYKDSRVTIYDNYSSGSLDFFDDNIKGKISFIESDIKDIDVLTSAVKENDIIFLLAANPDIARAQTHPDIDFWEGTYLAHNTLEAMRKSGASKIIYTSGSGVYGENKDIEFSEDYGPCIPISTYGASKLASESLIASYCHMYNFNARVLRFANVVGPNQTHGVGYDFLRNLYNSPSSLKILGDGTQTKSYIHISDVLQAINLMLLQLFDNNNDKKYDVYNVATGDYITVNKIADITCSILELNSDNVSYEYTGGDRGWKGDVPKIKFDCSKIYKIGWKSKMNSSEAIKNSLLSMLGEIKK
jgi:UDP-glucose 4-epimerase|tara:strand:+ start:2860 stop:3849 length:990 start_codon:yes stop_codon:yes gene_type:complete